jgi:hypothetical protein
MSEKHITIMIISTVPDMFAEHYFFIKNVFPELREICQNHDIELEYRDLFYSITEEEFNTCRSIRRYFTSIDSDRTFYICFRGQKLGCIPTHEDIDKETIQKYPELVDYIGDMSFTELTVMHAIHPFEKFENGEVKKLPPVKHSLFYFRDDRYLDKLSDSQREIYTCRPDCDDEFVQDLKLAMAKDLIVHNKREFDELKNNMANINVRKYNGIWDENVDLMDMIHGYTEEYANLINTPVEELADFYTKLSFTDSQGGFVDFECDGKSFKEVMIDDFLKELKLEFPENFS